MISSLITIIRKIPLVIHILIGGCLGSFFAAVCPEQSWIGIFGELFVKALKSVAPLLVLVLVTTAIANHSSKQKSGVKSLVILYFLTTFLAAILAVVACFMFPITLNLPAAAQGGENAVSQINQVVLNLVTGAVSNPVSALVDANYIAILVWAVALGMTFKKSRHSTKEVLTDLSTVVTEIVQIVIKFAPFGVMGLVFISCTQDGGFSNLLQYGKVIILLVSVMAIMMFIVNPLVVAFISKKNPISLTFTCIRDSAVYAFFTRSSAANIPVNMSLCDKMKVPRAMSSIAIPLGSTINMSGAAITITVLSLCAVFTMGIQNIDFVSALLLCIVASISAAGTSGVAGGSLMLVPLACSLFGISNDVAMQVVAIGFVIGVVQDSCETALNSSTDALFTIALSERYKAKGISFEEQLNEQNTNK
jgi:serine/threonine transporter